MILMISIKCINSSFSVVDGDNLSKFDEVGAREKSNIEDVETLDKLEWELASQSGRVTGKEYKETLNKLEQITTLPLNKFMTQFFEHHKGSIKTLISQ